MSRRFLVLWVSGCMLWNFFLVGFVAYKIGKVAGMQRAIDILEGRVK